MLLNSRQRLFHPSTHSLEVVRWVRLGFQVGWEGAFLAQREDSAKWQAILDSLVRWEGDFQDQWGDFQDQSGDFQDQWEDLRDQWAVASLDQLGEVQWVQWEDLSEPWEACTLQA